MRIRFDVLLFVVLTSFSSLLAQSDIYFSFSGLDDGNASQNTDELIVVGQESSVFVWVNNGVGVNQMQGLNQTQLEFGVSAGIEILNVDLFNPELIFLPDPGSTDFTRWDQISFGNQSVVTTDFGIGGILPEYDGSSVFLDPLYAPNSDAFLYAQVDFVVNEAGSYDFGFESALGAELFADAFFLTNSGATVNVVSVPEPSSVCVVALMIGLIRRPKRK